MNHFLLAGGILSLIASLLHVFIIIGGSSWYRYFHASEKMVGLVEKGSVIPMITTSAIAVVLFIWALYAFSGAGLVKKLPLLKSILVVITTIYMVRGLVLFPVIYFKPDIIDSFIVWSSIICIVYALTHAIGIFQVWTQIS